MWSGIIENISLGIIIIPNRFRVNDFLHFLQNEFGDILGDIPLAEMSGNSFQTDR